MDGVSTAGDAHRLDGLLFQTPSGGANHDLWISAYDDDLTFTIVNCVSIPHPETGAFYLLGPIMMSVASGANASLTAYWYNVSRLGATLAGINTAPLAASTRTSTCINHAYNCVSIGSSAYGDFFGNNQ